MDEISVMSPPSRLHGHRFLVVAVNGQRFKGAMRDMLQARLIKGAT